jgi:hypothetical protein
MRGTATHFELYRGSAAGIHDLTESLSTLDWESEDHRSPDAHRLIVAIIALWLAGTIPMFT